MTLQADVVRVQTDKFKIVHCTLPPWKDLEMGSVSEPSSIGIAFTAQQKAVIRKGSGPATPTTEPRTTPQGS
jgi:hypothetical protein